MNKSSKNDKPSGKKNVMRNFNLKNSKMKNMMFKNWKTSNRNIEIKDRNKSNDVKRHRSVSRSVDFSIDKKPRPGLGSGAFKSHFLQPDRKFEKRHSLNPDFPPKPSALKGRGKQKGEKGNILSVYLNDTRQSKKLVFQSNRNIPLTRKERTRDKKKPKRSSVGKDKMLQQTFQNKLDLKNFRLKDGLGQKSFKQIEGSFTFNGMPASNTFCLRERGRKSSLKVGQGQKGNFSALLNSKHLNSRGLRSQK